MAGEIPKVNAGDLVRHQHWNLMIDKIDELFLRVGVLEAATGASGVSIISVTSNTAPIRVGSRITVTGTGFVMPSQLNNVTVGGVTIAPGAFAFASDAQRLIFDVPAVPGLASTGTLVTLTVTNANGSASTVFMLHPLQAVPTGNIQVFYSSAPVMPATEPTITANRSYIFTFTIRTSVDLAAVYAVVLNLTGQPAWTAELLEESSDQPRPSPNIPIPGGMNVDTVARIRVTLPAGAAGGDSATFTLHVNAATAGTGILPGMSSPIAITVGSPPPTPETRARITLRSAVGAGGRVMMTRNTTRGVDFNLVAASPGLFNFTGAFRDPAGGTVNAIPPVNVPTASAGSPATVPFTAVVNPGSASMNTELVISVTRGSPPDLSVEYWLPVAIV
jgi:hypothetical protein